MIVMWRRRRKLLDFWCRFVVAHAYSTVGSKSVALTSRHLPLPFYRQPSDYGYPVSTKPALHGPQQSSSMTPIPAIPGHQSPQKALNTPVSMNGSGVSDLRTHALGSPPSGSAHATSPDRDIDSGIRLCNGNTRLPPAYTPH
jgi:hypothetical protein